MLELRIAAAADRELMLEIDMLRRDSEDKAAKLAEAFERLVAALAERPTKGWRIAVSHPEYLGARIVGLPPFHGLLVVYRESADYLDVLRVIPAAGKLAAWLQGKGSS